MNKAIFQGIAAAFVVVILPLVAVWILLTVLGLFWLGAILYMSGLVVALVWGRRHAPLRSSFR